MKDRYDSVSEKRLMYDDVVLMSEKTCELKDGFSKKEVREIEYRRRFQKFGNIYPVTYRKWRSHVGGSGKENVTR